MCSLSANKSHCSESDLLYFFVRVVCTVSQCGYIERAIAAFQAMIELSCYCPIDSASFGTKMSGLEEFWESELPRFGEKVTSHLQRVPKDGKMPLRRAHKKIQ
jgi:hypothetical protein